MFKPPPLLAQQIWVHPRTDKRRSASLLHGTLLGLGDLPVFPEASDCILDAMSSFEARPFRVVFDRIEERQVVALRAGERIRGAEAFQRHLRAFLYDRGIRIVVQPPELHISLRYRRDGLGTALVDPVSWRVSELLLIESVYGETRHVEHGRWALDPVPAAAKLASVCIS
jgi:2'-5' RNA ligase